MDDEVSDVILNSLRNMKVPHACGSVVELLLHFHLLHVNLLKNTYHCSEDVGVHQGTGDQQTYSHGYKDGCIWTNIIACEY
jgi:hypothetical protein